MARRGSGEVQITRRAIYTDPNTRAQRAIAPRLMSPYRGDPNDPYAGDRDPTFSRRLAGLREREGLADAASQAGNSVRNGRAASPDVEPYYARVRNSAIRGAQAQDVLHYQIRRGMANDAEASFRADQENIREWARMAIEGDWRNAQLMQEQQQFEAGQALDREQMGQHEELQREGWNRDERQARLGREAAVQSAVDTRDFQRTQSEEERKFQAEQGAEERKFTAGENKKNRRAQRRAIRDKAGYDAQQQQQKNRQSNKAMYSGMLPGLGYEPFNDLADPGKKESFEDTAGYLAGLPEYANASDEEIARAAADRMGLQPTGGAATSTGAQAVNGSAIRNVYNMANPGAAVANAVGNAAAKAWRGSSQQQAIQPAPQAGQVGAPYPGARQAKDGNWYVNVNGKWQMVVQQ